MKRYSIAKLLLVSCAFSFVGLVQAQSLVAIEDFEGGDGDWVDADRNTVTYNAAGGHDGGAYISVTDNIDTSSGGNFGAFTQFRCAVAPSQLPSQDCSSGAFVGNWYLEDGIQELRFWFRHNSTKAGGMQPTIRVAIPGNQVGGSGVFPAIPANTWTQIVLPIDPQDSAWDPRWGSLAPNAVQVLKNVGRLQPGIYFDPNDPVYSESGVTFDLDDVEIYGSPSVTAEINLLRAQPGNVVLHPHHDGGPNAVNGLNDPIRVAIFGALVTAGDPVDFDTDDIIASSLRLGQLGGSSTATFYNRPIDSDGIDDVRANTLTGDTGMNCVFPSSEPTDFAVRGELTTGEVFAGVDESISYNCNAQCHTELNNP